MAKDHRVVKTKNLDEQIEVLRRKQEECIKSNTTHIPIAKGCAGTWDGVLCWPSSPPGVLNTQPCPNYLVGFHSGNATRECTETGDWFVSPDTNATWTNLSQCFSGDSATVVIAFPNYTHLSKYLGPLKTISQVGYCVSIISLIIAFGILASFRRLRCPRNVLHMHLFLSFILRAFLSLLKASLFTWGAGLSSDFQGEVFVGEEYNNWGCKVIMSLWEFTIMSNYSWILVEGLYLHNLIFLALFSDTSAVTCYIILGWSLPLLNVIPWAVIRAKLDDTLCWTTYNNRLYSLIMEIPIVIFMGVNFILFLNIVRVLLLKLTASISEENRRYRYRKWAKSTLVLVPLFGVHSVLFIWLSYLDTQGPLEMIWLYIDQLFNCFQGFFVAVLYCFLNGEVRCELQKKWSKARAAARLQDSWTEGGGCSGRRYTGGGGSGGPGVAGGPQAAASVFGGLVRAKRTSSKSRRISIASHFFNPRRKRGSSVESCITTFLSTSAGNNTNNCVNPGGDVTNQRRPTLNNQYIETQTDAAAAKMLVCSV